MSVLKRAGRSVTGLLTVRGLLVTLVAATSLTGCGGTGSTGPAPADDPAPAQTSDSAATEATTEEAEAEGAPVEGKVDGDLTLTLSQGGRTEKRSGRLTFALDCAKPDACTTKNWSATGDFAQASESFFHDYLALDWEGGEGRWTAEGATPKSCDDVAGGDMRDFVDGTLSVDDAGQVEMVAELDEYSFKQDKGTCVGAGATFDFTGKLS